jgi:hypothetical protein
MLTTNQIPLITTMSAEDYEGQVFDVPSVIQHKSRLTI